MALARCRGSLILITHPAAVAGFLEKEVIHVSLSLYRDLSDGVDHLEHRLDRWTRFVIRPWDMTMEAAAGDRSGLCFLRWLLRARKRAGTTPPSS
jgi:hypothetical protein